MTTLWLTKEEVCALTGWSVRHLQRVAATGAVESRDSARQIYRGQPVKEYSLASLPAAARAQYLDGRKCLQSEEQPDSAPATMEASRLALLPPAQLVADADTTALAVQIPSALPIRVDLPPAAEKEAMRRMAILKPLLEYLRNPAARNASSPANSDALVQQLAAQHGVSERTLWRWKTQFDKEGRFALARKPRADKNRSAWAAENADLADLAALVYMGNDEQPAQSVRVAWEQVCERAERMGVSRPSYETVRSFLRNPNEVSPSMLTYGREGRRKYDARFAPFMSRGYTEPANSIWVSDHMIHDVLVQDDLFKRDLKHMRLQMTTLLDYRARYVVGVCWCENGSSHSIKRALLRAFSQYGLPDRFYCDNGKDYRKVARGASDKDFFQRRRAYADEMELLRNGVLQRVGVPVTFCEPFHPQSKHIERYHRTVHERFDKSFLTYTAGQPHLRPDATTAALARHGKLLTMGRAQDSQLPLASEFVAMCEAWIESWYHQQPQDGEGMDGRSPAQVFEAERGPGRPCPEPALLAMLLCERTPRKVMNMQIELDKDFFVADPADPYANFQMHERSGRWVTVAYDPLDPMFAAVLDEDGNYLCRLQRKDLMRFSSDNETREQIAGFIGNRNSLRKAVRESRADLNRRVRSAGYTTLEEQHRERLQLPRAVGENIVQSPERPLPDSGSKHTHAADNVARYFERLGGANGAQ